MKVSNKDTVDLQSTGRSSRAKRAEAAAIEAKAKDTSDVNAARGDSSKVELSSDAKVLAKGIDAAKSAEISDKEKIASIKQRIKDGTYNPDLGEVAERMLNEHTLSS